MKCIVDIYLLFFSVFVSVILLSGNLKIWEEMLIYSAYKWYSVWMEFLCWVWSCEGILTSCAWLKIQNKTKKTSCWADYYGLMMHCLDLPVTVFVISIRVCMFNSDIWYKVLILSVWWFPSWGACVIWKWSHSQWRGNCYLFIHFLRAELLREN